MLKDYTEFLKTKQKKHIESGFEIEEKELNEKLFDFQKHIVKRALKAGRYAIFADCGLGKTIMQLEWAQNVVRKTNRPVLILAPLAVSGQTIEEGQKFGIDVYKYLHGAKHENKIYIINYEQLEKIDTSIFSGVVLDESSILKNFTGKTKNLIISSFKNTEYKLACTATPAPNDLNEIGNHSCFLDIMDSEDMRMRWFVRDEGLNNYRLKNHSEDDFFGWIGSWSTVIRKPSDIGFENAGYDLPGLNLIEKKIETAKQDNGLLFNEKSINATNFNSELRRSQKERLGLVAEIVNNSKENFIVWIKQNEEGDHLRKLIPDAIEVKGNDTQEYKEKYLLGFARGEFRVLITKQKIAMFGLNYQNCNNQIFASLDFSFEGLYQSIRRSYRFGQSKDVNIFLITTDTMENVKESIDRKQKMFNAMVEGIINKTKQKEYKLKMDYARKENKTEDFHIIRGDSVELINEIEDESIDFSVFSPPFSTLFTYSDNLRDFGNCEDNNQFFEQNQFLLNALYKKIKNGRLVAVHSKDLARYKNSSGYTGLYDFTGDYHRAMEKAGFKYHSKITIWTDPVLEMQRTKTQRLLYKQVTSDSSYSGIGLPEYVTIFKKWEGNEDDWTPITNLTKQNFSLDTWQQWASPVWMDIRRTDVLQNWRDGKTEKDEKHICPLQISVVERLIALYSNRGEVVFTPFMGIGTEVVQAVKMGRIGKGIELKEEYYNVAEMNVQKIIEEKKQSLLFEA